MVRCFENDDIIHVQEGGNKSAPIDPVGDAEVIETELVLADNPSIGCSAAALCRMC